jgi:branched-chain amino acid aminotransferase
MAAGTAAGLVPIRSITRHIPASNPRSLAATARDHPRAAVADDGTETVTYLPDAQADAGPICSRLLGELKGIQVGKVEDRFGWCARVEEKDGEGLERC